MHYQQCTTSGKFQIEAYLSTQYLITVGIQATEINTITNDCSY